jgi:hypothetical protein
MQHRACCNRTKTSNFEVKTAIVEPAIGRSIAFAPRCRILPAQKARSVVQVELSRANTLGFLLAESLLYNRQSPASPETEQLLYHFRRRKHKRHSGTPLGPLDPRRRHAVLVCAVRSCKMLPRELANESAAGPNECSAYWCARPRIGAETGHVTASPRSQRAPASAQ